MASGINGDARGVTTLVSGLRRPPVRVILLAAATVLLWAILVIQLWVPVPEQALYVVTPAAVTVPVLAAVRREGRRPGPDDDAYARVIGDLAERLARAEHRHLRLAGSGPLPRA